MARCIFCKDSSGQFTTREHILPESLGGSDWAVLPGGLYCDACQNRFGSEIEQQALGDYPFSFFRVFLGIPTKKGNAPWFKSWEGTIRASLQPGAFGYDPALPFQKATEDGSKTQIRLIAHPLKPDMVCRFLLKMGIEVFAANSPDDVFHGKFDAARHYALTGEKAVEWWYLQHERIDEVSLFLTRGASEYEWPQNVSLEVIDLGAEQEMFHLSLLYLDMFSPLTAHVQPQIEGLAEPDFRLFRV
ncbi:MAG: HNH endonuclease [Terriglobia bacterium]